MPDLLQGPSPRTIRFATSLPHSVLATIGLMCAAPHFEGLGEWLDEARMRLPADLLAELCLLVTFPGQYQRFTAELIARLPAKAAEPSFEALMAHLETIPGADYQQMALQALARGATPQPDPKDLFLLLDKPTEWAAYLNRVESEVAPETVAALVRDGQGLKSRLLTALDRFWREAYAQEFERTHPLMAQSLAHYRSQPHNPNFRDLFVAVTGRLVPERVMELLPTIRDVTFIPSCYVGPYIAYTHHPGHLILFYNCRAKPSGPTVVDGSSLYPPLKALADETRLQIVSLLQGRELYAQEIVEQLDISQPAVSRHLNLMAAAGILRIRRDGSAKYYSVNTDTLARVADTLRGLG
jgi:hypothetical protein